jgi:hypothetical protein
MTIPKLEMGRKGKGKESFQSLPVFVKAINISRVDFKS